MAPVPSPFIRACRYGLLSAGLVYGFTHRHSLEKVAKRDKILAEQAQEKAAAAKKKAEAALLAQIPTA
eukprot:m.333296 g.333296  ORF g.333296 m.333296 type:complete len:68 (+) comp17111_c0_seq1:56-259(+)